MRNLAQPDSHADVSRFAAELAGKTDQGWRKIWQIAAGFGLLRRMMPSEHGGQGETAQEFSAAMVALGQGYADNGMTMGLNSHVWTVQQPLLRFGTASQISQYLPDFMNGDSIGAFAMTEAASGSDALALTTRAEKRDGGYVLNGTKAFIGMGPVCDVAIVFASTKPEHGSWGITAFLVEAGDAGFIRAPAQSKMGLTTLPMGPMQFEDCYIPEDRRLGPEGAGARIFQATLDWERSFILASHLGAMIRQFDACSTYAKSREVFDQPIGEFQSVSNRLADMRLRIETSRLMLEKAAMLYDTDAPLTLHAAMTNLHMSEAFLASSMDAMRNFAGVGYLDGATVGNDLKDALGGVIYSGTSDVQRQIIARMAEHDLPKIHDIRNISAHSDLGTKGRHA